MHDSFLRVRGSIISSVFRPGRKTIKQKTNLDVDVDRGMNTQQPIVLAGKGDQSTDAEHGDIVVRLLLQDHETFVRQENDLYVTKTISLTEALCGFQMNIRHLDGRTLLISQPAGDVVTPGSVKGIRGEGMPIYRGDSNGNMYIKFTVAFPEKEFMQKANFAVSCGTKSQWFMKRLLSVLEDDSSIYFSNYGNIRQSTWNGVVYRLEAL